MDSKRFQELVEESTFNHRSFADLYTCGVCDMKMWSDNIHEHLQSHVSVCTNYQFNNETKTIMPVFDDITHAEAVGQKRKLPMPEPEVQQKVLVKSPRKQVLYMPKSYTEVQQHADERELKTDLDVQNYLNSNTDYTNRLSVVLDQVQHTDSEPQYYAAKPYPTGIIGPVNKMLKKETKSPSTKRKGSSVKAPKSKSKAKTKKAITGESLATNKNTQLVKTEPLNIGDTITRIDLPYTVQGKELGTYHCSVVIESFTPKGHQKALQPRNKPGKFINMCIEQNVSSSEDEYDDDAPPQSEPEYRGTPMRTGEMQNAIESITNLIGSPVRAMAIPVSDDVPVKGKKKKGKEKGKKKKEKVKKEKVKKWKIDAERPTKLSVTRSRKLLQMSCRTCTWIDADTSDLITSELKRTMKHLCARVPNLLIYFESVAIIEEFDIWKWAFRDLEADIIKREVGTDVPYPKYLLSTLISGQKLKPPQELTCQYCKVEHRLPKIKVEPGDQAVTGDCESTKQTQTTTASTSLPVPGQHNHMQTTASILQGTANVNLGPLGILAQGNHTTPTSVFRLPLMSMYQRPILYPNYVPPLMFYVNPASTPMKPASQDASKAEDISGQTPGSLETTKQSEKDACNQEYTAVPISNEISQDTSGKVLEKMSIQSDEDNSDPVTIDETVYDNDDQDTSSLETYDTADTSSQRVDTSLVGVNMQKVDKVGTTNEQTDKSKQVQVSAIVIAGHTVKSSLPVAGSSETSEHTEKEMTDTINLEKLDAQTKTPVSTKVSQVETVGSEKTLLDAKPKQKRILTVAKIRKEGGSPGVREKEDGTVDIDGVTLSKKFLSDQLLKHNSNPKNRRKVIIYVTRKTNVQGTNQTKDSPKLTNFAASNQTSEGHVQSKPQRKVIFVRKKSGIDTATARIVVSSSVNARSSVSSVVNVANGKVVAELSPKIDSRILTKATAKNTTTSGSDEVPTIAKILGVQNKPTVDPTSSVSASVSTTNVSSSASLVLHNGQLLMVQKNPSVVSSSNLPAMASSDITSLPTVTTPAVSNSMFMPFSSPLTRFQQPLLQQGVAPLQPPVLPVNNKALFVHNNTLYQYQPPLPAAPIPNLLTSNIPQLVVPPQQATTVSDKSGAGKTCFDGETVEKEDHSKHTKEDNENSKDKKDDKDVKSDKPASETPKRNDDLQSDKKSVGSTDIGINNNQGLFIYNNILFQYKPTVPATTQQNMLVSNLSSLALPQQRASTVSDNTGTGNKCSKKGKENEINKDQKDDNCSNKGEDIEIDSEENLETTEGRAVKTGKHGQLEVGSKCSKEGKGQVDENCSNKCGDIDDDPEEHAEKTEERAAKARNHEPFEVYMDIATDVSEEVKGIETDSDLQKNKLSAGVKGTENKSKDAKHEGYTNCDICEVDLLSKDGLYFHNAEKHTHKEILEFYLEKYQRYFCVGCGHSEVNKRLFMTHVSLCQAAENCRFNKFDLTSFKNHSYLTQKLPEDAPRYPCQYCEYIGISKAALKNHQLLRCKSKPLLQCDMCSYKTLSKISFGDHKFKVHQIKDFQCTTCPRSFANVQSLNTHERMKHKETERVKRKLSHVETICEKCGKICNTKLAYHKHMKAIHNLAATCLYCDSVFFEGYHCRIHEGNHTGDYRFSCVTCRNVFSSGVIYRSHMKSRHDIEGGHSDQMNNTLRRIRRLIFTNFCTICKESFQEEKLYLQHMTSRHSVSVEDARGARLVSLRQERLIMYRQKVEIGEVVEAGFQIKVEETESVKTIKGLDQGLFSQSVLGKSKRK